jgi:hypothetical protein
LVPALLVLAAIFCLLFLTRVGGAYRAIFVRRWPVVLLAAAAILALFRGAVAPGLAMLALSALAWAAWPRIEAMLRPSPQQQSDDTAEDSAARALLEVGLGATADEIRRAYRKKMAQSHPDRGGAHNEAARLTAARDRLLKKGR